MTESASDFFRRMKPSAQENVAWQGGAIRLRHSVYLTEEVPPLGWVSSVRAVLFVDAGCALLTNADGVHVLPGGRREPEETIEETLQREILEETGCLLTWTKRFALLHFHHVTPKPPGYPYPYPDFVHVVFAARGHSVRAPCDPDNYESRVEFVAPSKLASFDIPQHQRLLLGSAMQVVGWR